jgi:hypothetical protein
MTGGSLNLASTQGTGDDILSISPQITFFKKIYKRHTNFGLETREITNSTNSSVNFGESVIYTIDKSGSLINNMYIEFTLPPAINSDGKNKGGITVEKGSDDGAVTNWDQYCCWVNAVGFAILDEVKLEIDGNTIDKHNGIWYDIWNELNDVNRKEWSLVGKRDDGEEKIQKLKSRYYVPLKFYFNRNQGLSLPIFLLDDNKIKISLSLKSMASLLTFDTTTSPAFNTSVSISNFKFFTNYVFLDTAEQNKISNNLPTEYLIETLDIKENLNENDLSKITLNNPVKELIWVIRNKTRISTASAANGAKVNNADEANNTNNNDIFNYSLAVENTNLGYGTYDTFKTLKFSISNQDRIQETDATHFRTIQPYNHHSNIPGGYGGNESRKYIYSYSFAINPEEYQPSGSYNFTKADDDLKIIFTGFGNPTTNTNEFDDYRLDLFAFHYKYLSINKNGITFKDVPYSSNVQTDTLADSPEFKGVDEAVVKGIIKKKCKDRTEEALIVEEKRLIAIEAEVRRRYSERKPDIHNHQNFTKKKWSGLQGTHKEI